MTELDPQLVERAIAEALKRPANLDYFFDKLSSADWIAPLRELGLFSEPPEQFVDEQGYVHAPPWSASRYLARVAALRPGEVVEVISSISTNNERVHADFVDAALQMPPEQSRAIALHESSWLSAQDHLYFGLPDKAVALASKLAVEDQMDLALALLTTVFAVVPLADGRSDAPRPGPKLATWDYGELLRQATALILPLASERFLWILMGLLRDALDILRDGADDQAFDALTRITRPEISQTGNRSDHADAILISAVRDAAVAVRAEHVLDDESVVRVLTSRDEEIARRIAMYVFAQDPQPGFELLRGWLLDPTQFTSDEPSVEYRVLLNKNASRLPPDDLRALLEIIQQGPDLAAYRRRAERNGFDLTEEQVADHVAWWQAARLKLLSPALDQEWVDQLQELQARVGEAEFVTSGVVHTSWGPTSPLSSDELAAMPDPELLAALRDWTPADTWMGPSTEGLGRALGELARRDPARIIGLLGPFRSLRLEYIEHVVRGLRQAVEDAATLAWEPVVDLLQWLVERPEDAAHADADGTDGVRTTARREAMFLLEKGLRTQGSSPPLELRGSIWQAISQVASDSQPTPDYEERYGGSNMDPVMLSLNTTRPSAIRAAIAYAVWLQRVTAVPDGSTTGDGWLSPNVSEVGDLLDERLRDDPSAAVRAVVGQHFTNIYALDRSWAQSHVLPVFPHEDTQLREASWGSYIIYSAPYNDLLTTLRSAYERSAELVDTPGHGFRWMNGDPRSRLGDHLVTFYWRGLIELADPLLETFWTRAPSQIRTDALTSVGRALMEYEELPDEPKQRVIELWKFAVDHRAADDGSELGAFAWWFASAGLPVRWRLEQLIALLDLGIRPDPTFLVTRELPVAAEREPHLATRALRTLLELERESWTIGTSVDDISRVLSAALESDDQAARELATDTVHWLGAIGYRDYRALLSTPAPTDAQE